MCSVCRVCRSTCEALPAAGLKHSVSQMSVRRGLGLTRLTQETDRPQTQFANDGTASETLLPPPTNSPPKKKVLTAYFRCWWLGKLYNSAPHGNDPEHILHRNFFWSHNRILAAETATVPTSFWKRTDWGSSSALPWLIKWPRKITNHSKPASQLKNEDDNCPYFVGSSAD